ncbi:MAG: magnesium transporter MgtE N-terminal domain-containing protein [Terriglobales bacterium]
MYYFTELLGWPILDAAGRRLGRLREIVIDPGQDPSLAQSLIFRRDGRLWAAPARLADIGPAGVQLRPEATAAPLAEDGAMAGQLWVRRDMLDQQIIDVHGRKVVRVNDVDFEAMRRDPGVDLRAVQVDVGFGGALRRLVQGVLPRPWMIWFSTRGRPRVIPWHLFDLVETDPARRVRLQISYSALSRLHPADLADIVEDLAPAERGAVFQALNNAVAAEVLGEVEPRFQRSLLENLALGKAADIVEEMEPDEAADVLRELPVEVSEGILEDMRAEERDEVSELLDYAEDTAGGRMTTEFVALPAEAKVADAITALRHFEAPVEGVHAIFVNDEQQHLAGMVPLARLLLADANAALSGLAMEAPSVAAAETDRKIAELFDKYNLTTLAVVDRHRRLVGIITVDDVIGLLRER